MSAATLIREAETDGLRLTVTDAGTLKCTGPKPIAERWAPVLREHKAEIMAVFAQCYGAELAAVWFQRWRMFYMACAELFGFDDGREWLVGHYRFVRA